MAATGQRVDPVLESVTPTFSPTIAPTHTPSPKSQAAPTSTATPPPLPQGEAALLGQIGGAARAVAVRGNYAYLGIGPRLAVIDVSDPRRPYLVGKSGLFGERIVQAVALADDRAYVITNPCHQSFEYYYTFSPCPSALFVVNISDPVMPSLLAALDLPGGAQALVARGTFLYVAGGEAGLQVIDVQDAEKPKLVGWLETPAIASGVAVEGQHAYLAIADSRYQEGGLWVVDISDPQAPRQVSFLNMKDASAVAVSERLAYVMATNGLWVVDISEPTNPKQYSIISNPFDLYFDDLILSQETLYVRGHFCQLGICFDGNVMVDVSDPASPTWVLDGNPKIAPSSAASGREMVLMNGLIYLASGTGLEIRDAAGPDVGQLTGAYEVPGPAADIEIVGGLAYMVDWSRRLQVIDVQDPSNPTILGSFSMPRAETCQRCRTRRLALEVRDGYAYYWDGLEAVLWVVDVRNPSQPRLAGQIEFEIDLVTGMAVGEGYAYLVNSHLNSYGNYSLGLTVVDVGNPERLQQVGFTEVPGEHDVIAITASGGFVYLAQEGCSEQVCRGALKIIDVGDPVAPRYTSNPVVIGAHSVVMVGSYAYVSGLTCPFCPSRLNIIDVSDPVHPAQVDALEGLGSEVILAGDKAYVPTALDGVQVLDLSDPAHPRPIGSYPMITGISAVIGDWAFAAAGSDGLFLWHLNPLLSR